MTLIDAIILLIVLGGLVLGYRKGFIGQLSSLVSWVVAIVLCYKCGDLAQSLFLAIVPSAAEHHRQDGIAGVCFPDCGGGHQAAHAPVQGDA